MGVSCNFHKPGDFNDLVTTGIRNTSVGGALTATAATILLLLVFLNTKQSLPGFRVSSLPEVDRIWLWAMGIIIRSLYTPYPIY